MGQLDGKVALVTGAARGMGAAHVRAMVDQGARVVATDVLDDEGQQVVAGLGDAATYLHQDVRDEAGWDQAVDAARHTYGRFDVLVNNAGVLQFASLTETTLDDYRRIVDVNQVGCFLGMRAAGRAMVEAGAGGSIVNVSSVAGLTGVPFGTAYAASKWAVRGMSRSAAKELGRHGIRVNSVHPGGVDTPMVADARIGDPEAHYRRQPIPRIGQPEEVAALVVWLASDASSYCTGAEFVVDGGASA